MQRTPIERMLLELMGAYDERLRRHSTETAHLADARRTALGASSWGTEGVERRMLGAIAGAVVGRSNDRYEVIKVAALAHHVLRPQRRVLHGLAVWQCDIGKIGIPRHVLSKSGSLTEREWAQVRQHPLISRRILAAYDRPHAAQLAGCHHERWDGRGYPAGLTGERIPIGARITLYCVAVQRSVAVADAYATMTSRVPYQEAQSRFAALAELRRNSGTQFDPDVVEAACSVISRQAGMLRVRRNGDRAPQETNGKTT